MQEEVEVDKLKLKTQSEQSQAEGDDENRFKSGHRGLTAERKYTML